MTDLRELIRVCSDVNVWRHEILSVLVGYFGVHMDQISIPEEVIATAFNKAFKNVDDRALLFELEEAISKKVCIVCIPSIVKYGSESQIRRSILTQEEYQMYPYMSSLDSYIQYTPTVTPPPTDKCIMRITSKDGSIVELFSYGGFKVIVSDQGVTITQK